MMQGKESSDIDNIAIKKINYFILCRHRFVQFTYHGCIRKLVLYSAWRTLRCMENTFRCMEKLEYDIGIRYPSLVKSFVNELVNLEL